MKILKCGKGVETVFVPTPKIEKAPVPVVVHSKPSTFRTRIEYALKTPYNEKSEARCSVCQSFLDRSRVDALASLKLAPETWKCMDCIVEMATNFKKKDEKLDAPKNKEIQVTYFCEKCHDIVKPARVAFLKMFHVSEDEYRCVNCCLSKDKIKKYLMT